MKRLIFLFLLLATPVWAQEPIVCVMPHGDSVPSPLVGIKIYYGDDTVVRIAAAGIATGWLRAKSDGVQVVRLYYGRTYSVWDAVQGRAVLRAYAETIQGHDHYWWSPTKGFGNTDRVSEVPADVVAVKIGTLLPDGEFLRIYNKAHNDHAF